MTDVLADLKAAFEKTTKGEWKAGRPDMATVVDGFDSKWIYAGDQYCMVASGRIEGEWPEVMGNAEWTATAHNHWTALLDVVEKAGELNAAYTNNEVPLRNPLFENLRSALAYLQKGGRDGE